MNSIIEKTTKLSTVKIFITSWNMGNAEASGFNNVFEEKNVRDSYDIIVIGLQESTYNVKGSKDPFKCISHLSEQIKKTLGAGFYQVTHCYRAQLQLYVFAKQILKDRISHVEMSIENTGFLHVFPNKGGLLVAFQVDGSKLAFVSCHLTAHEGVKHCEQRNCSIVEILGGVRAGNKDIDITEQYHHVFWMGDMNYRLTYDQDTPANTKKNIKELNEAAAAAVDSKQIDIQLKADDKLDGMEDDSESDDDDDNLQLTRESSTGRLSKKQQKAENRAKIVNMIVDENWKELLELDELNREIAAGRVLNDFTALQPSFPPTFKRARNLCIQPNSESSDPKKWILNKSSASTVDTYYNSKRIPSFTDRILFKSLDTFKPCLSPLFFESCEKALSSDHKPVRAGFELHVSKGSSDIFVEKKIVHWDGKVSSKTSGKRDDVHILRLTVSNLKGYNLEEMDSAMFGGGSDPYIVISTDPEPLLLNKGILKSNPEPLKTKVIKHNINPVWDDVLEIGLASVDLEGLSRNANLILTVWDEDFSNADDLIGILNIPFKKLLTRLLVERIPYEFDEVIRSNSEIMGRISGTITLNSDIAAMEGTIRQISSERGRNANYYPLSHAVLDANHHSGCGCLIQ